MRELLAKRGLPTDEDHASIHDTSALLALETTPGQWVRKDKLSLADAKTGVQGHPQFATPELGNIYNDMKAGEAMVLQNNYFVEKILPNAILRKLSDDEMAEYRRSFAEPGEGRRPTLTWPRQIPIEGEPADVHAIATEYADWLGTSNVPKLFLKAEPGAILANDTLVNLVRGWPALTEKTVAGIHFVQEDSPDEIGRAIAGWMLKL